MNTSGMLRGYLAKVLDHENYFYHVMNCMEVQFHDWEHETMLLFDWGHTKEIHATFIIDEHIYSLAINKEIVAALQRKNPYALDRYIWEHLIEQGFELKESNYILLAFSEL
ncbi:hypothetical protein [Bacillus thermotolerans]|uniref:Uncharacterized protein n=1 Tax=Bacillus thermotolerans TaxID=1221996 RepID=A0A0F5HUD2_BACTR|nr:hypothetical protein [Bacillus thermotolerans]KKB34307.1 hypothetical protein QY97_02533 [Bacillus thermotolerans]KKB36858.1 hypothetical protein QY95_02932 [Bacillus thermotolerans]